MKRRLFILPLLVLLLTGHLVYSQPMAPPQPDAAHQPVLGTYNLGVLNLPLAAAAPLLPDAMPLLSLVKAGTTTAEPDGLATYEIQLTNEEAVSRTFTLTEQLPDNLSLNGIEVVSATHHSLHYSRATHTLSWQGRVAGGHLDYTLHPEEAGPPYIDLALYGAVNLCDAFIAAGQRCDEAAVTFNLGINGRSFPFYGRAFTNLTLSADGLLLLPSPMPSPITTPLPNGWLPDADEPGHLIAGLWRDNDLTDSGRWHAGIIAGWINGLDVFYAQWQDAPQAANPNATARHAIALTLGPSGGDIYFLYDNLSDPAAEIAQGYTIGLQDGIGERGLTYAYAPCCGESHPPRGYPPPPGTVLHLHPLLLAGDTPYRVTFRYQVRLDADIPVGSFIPTTVTLQSDSPDPALNDLWATHYLYVRELLYLPLVITTGEEE